MIAKFGGCEVVAISDLSSLELIIRICGYRRVQVNGEVDRIGSSLLLQRNNMHSISFFILVCIMYLRIGNSSCLLTTIQFFYIFERKEQRFLLMGSIPNSIGVWFAPMTFRFLNDPLDVTRLHVCSL